ncbi:MAG TPA: UDP-glucose 4-epimerase GalE, partial [Clostridiales bacterium]|nr:UDP-glucose 4-epimerase GalE [Clostridiales bacterium]
SKFVFSSSATVYGDQESPFKEDMELMETTNPYGETKAMSERILKDTAKANEDFGVSLLRYFNPVGAHESGLIGEDPNGIPNNLMPFITKVGKGELDKLYIFGNDYDTVDGTGVRDYIHVVDLAEGHVAALENLNPGINIYNLGTGKGTSVLEMVDAFKKVNKVDVPYEIVQRRKGDIAKSFADVSKAEKDLKWKAKRGIEEMVRDAWRFENS